jgi:hypothetical protein
MLHTRIVARIVSSIAAFAWAVSVAAWGQAGSDAQASKQKHVLEMTRVDVFSEANWTSEEIKILGFHLGMSRADAEENARSHGLTLRCLKYCDVCDTKNVLCKGIGFYFGADDSIESIFVFRPLQEASQKLRNFSVTQEFKGQTFRIFHSYSNDLRLRLFGPESRKEEELVTRTTKYLYSKRGVELEVALSPNKSVSETDADLTITFARGQRPDTKAINR